MSEPCMIAADEVGVEDVMEANDRLGAALTEARARIGKVREYAEAVVAMRYETPWGDGATVTARDVLRFLGEEADRG